MMRGGFVAVDELHGLVVLTFCASSINCCWPFIIVIIIVDILKWPKQ